jgi:hypothetical protein
MSIQFTVCPVCKQKLGVMDYVEQGTLLVCANPECDTSLRLVARRPLRVEVVPEQETYAVEFRPESYG